MVLCGSNLVVLCFFDNKSSGALVDLQLKFANRTSTFVFCASIVVLYITRNGAVVACASMSASTRPDPVTGDRGAIGSWHGPCYGRRHEVPSVISICHSAVEGIMCRR